ncbi:hypothetical protein BGZ96_003069 [Linnemannia gamsii]|uniref:Uncharacterized protein n=1 Tax=Linnemannia gamsii TaxID=64522 RepID=A0ABQ7JJT4_9FUNG|nr:hypothetical protein BGZ96_003069 [Linnemannia gamsii]
MSMIRTSSTSTTTVAKRLISSSARANNAAVSINHTAVASAAPSNGAKTAKTVACTVLGSTAVVAGVSHLFKDEVVYWTPNKKQ